MRPLLDENLPKKLKIHFPEHEIYTVSDRGWKRIKNGELLKLLIANEFDALMTFDKNMQYQQNFSKYSITVFVLVAKINTYSVLVNLIHQIKEYLTTEKLKEGKPIIISEL